MAIWLTLMLNPLVSLPYSQVSDFYGKNNRNQASGRSASAVAPPSDRSALVRQVAETVLGL